LIGKAWRVAGLLLLATLAGAGSAGLRLKFLSGADDIRLGPWRSSSLVGSAQASAWLRAVVAVNGILALNQREAIYFTALADDDGRPLSGACRYRVGGHDVAARWWSLTAYGADRFLIPNPGHRYSATQNTVARAADGSYSIRISREPQAGDWIASGSGRFVLTLRAYMPSPALADHPEQAGLPGIVREGCT